MVSMLLWLKLYCWLWIEIKRDGKESTKVDNNYVSKFVFGSLFEIWNDIAASEEKDCSMLPLR